MGIAPRLETDLIKSGARVPEVFSLGVQVSIDIRFIGEQALTA